MVTHPASAAPGRAGQHSDSCWDATLPGACLLPGVFLFVPFNTREASQPSVGEALPQTRQTLPACHAQDEVPACSLCVNTSVPNSADRKSTLKYFYSVNYTA